MLSAKKHKYLIPIAGFFAALSSSLPLAVASEEATSHSIMNGQIIHLDPESLQRVKVRAKTLTVGGCALTFNFADEMAGVFALPFNFTEWIAIGPGMTGGSHKISYRKECSNVPIVVEAKYWKDSSFDHSH